MVFVVNKITNGHSLVTTALHQRSMLFDIGDNLRFLGCLQKDINQSNQNDRQEDDTNGSGRKRAETSGLVKMLTEEQGEGATLQRG